MKEQSILEVSDALKTRYIHKAMRDVDNKERASQLADKQGAPASVGKSLSSSTKKRREGVRLARSKLGDVPKKGMSESSLQEKSAAEVLKKRYASYHADDNPQATRRLRDDEHDQPKGANVYKMHPGVKLTDRGYSKKGKMAALKKQHARRPEQYGITKEESKFLVDSPPPWHYEQQLLGFNLLKQLVLIRRKQAHNIEILKSLQCQQLQEKVVITKVISQIKNTTHNIKWQIRRLDEVKD